jgi:hypothetical protein
VGDVVIHDVTDPGRASFVTYINHRDFAFSGATPGRPATSGSPP